MTDLMPILGYDHIEFYVGNAKQAAHYYRTAFGFTPVAYAGPETGRRDAASWVLEQGDIRFVLTAGLAPDDGAVRHAAAHGDGVRDVAFRVPDAEEAFRVAVSRGAQPVSEPAVAEDDHGKIITASIKAYGDTLHSFVDRSNYSGPFAPGYQTVGAADADAQGLRPVWTVPAGHGVGLRHVDHVVANVELGQMNTWVRYYADIMGFSQLVHFDDQAISTEYTALMSKVLWDGEGRIKLPINEPAQGKRKSQIEEYLDYYRSPGVQHMALATDDIVATVSALRANGLRFMRVPDTYYDDVRARLDWSTIDEDLARLAEHNILVDQDDEGYLLQIFTEPVQDRPTVFYEVIERHGSRGFGVGNFKALFEAIEREQELRGNL
ncbi:MAG TPA: 4-hydroxyphenylpyruvate dioxygenase [Egibacteraceae bacterium]|nr:4-hydroxyphenylpyruvate dioxygenase [Egibacteraceae bacterium]